MFQPQTLSDRAQIEARRDEHMGRLLQRAWRVFNTQAIAKLRGRGHGGLTLAHTALLANLDLDGTRITALAERAGMTKQSMGQLALDLEAHGYVTRAPDPTDRRATLVRFTERGGQFLRDAGVVGVGRGHINGLQTRRLHKLGEAGGAQERRIGRLHGGQRLLVEVAECHQSAIGGSGNGRGHVVAGHPAAANDAPADGSSMRNSHNQ